ncbi:MAG: TonB-dependent receptor [Flaviramulus sp.]|nr:TonB-dependent receptor [Flaviramulus sp.]
MEFLKRSLLFFLICGFNHVTLGQDIFKGKIVDSDNGVGLAFTQIINIEDKKNSISNFDGTFEINKSGSYLFKKEGYIEKTIELIENQYYIIQLNIKPSELNEVVINANHIPTKLKKTTATISIVSSEDIQRSNNTDFAPILNRTPGVFMQSGALNTNRITIRGIGSRNLFGTSKIRAYFKDIPLTNGSGETTIEDFELASISRLEIIKGAASSIYGAGLGGTINLIPQNAYLNDSNFNGEISMGSFGLIKGILNVNHGNSENSFRAVYSNTESDGFRENNNYKRQTFTLTSNHFLSKKDELSFIVSYVDLKAFIPSSINENTYLNSPKSAAFTWKQAQGFEDSKRGVFGLSWQHNFNNNLKQNTSIFTSFRDAYEPRPFDILKENTLALGLRTRLIGNTNLFGRNLNWTLGGELFKDTYKYSTFENLYEDFPNGTGSVSGQRLSNFIENRNYYNLFFETNFEFSEKTTLTTGLNLNETGYKLNDKFHVTSENPNQSGSFKFKNILSPKIGISHLFNKNISIYGSVSHGFSPISLNETLLPDGQINANLKPETGWNFEAGSRGEFFSNKLQYNFAFYRLNIKNLLVSRRTAEDAFIGINAGKTQHDGLELALNYYWLQNKKITISSFINYTLNKFIFKEFIDNTNNFSGNDLTGVPSDIFNAGIDFETSFSLYGNINYQYVGSFPITDSNSLFTEDYQLTNLKVGYKTNLSKYLKMNIFLGINNIFNEKYASQILINATSFGSSAPRYYYPGNPSNYFTGFNLNYLF